MDHIDTDSIEEVKKLIRWRLERASAGGKTTSTKAQENRHEPKYFCTYVSLRQSGITARFRTGIRNMPPQRRGEFIVESRNLIRLEGPDGHHAEGTAVLADRCDRMWICFELWTAEIEIDDEGRLVFLGKYGSIEQHDPSRHPIILRDEVEAIVFERVTDVLDANYCCAWSDGISFVGVDNCDKPNLSFSLLAPELLDRLVQRFGNDEAVDAFAATLQWMMESFVNRAFNVVMDGNSSTYRHSRMALQERRNGAQAPTDSASGSC